MWTMTVAVSPSASRPQTRSNRRSRLKTRPGCLAAAGRFLLGLSRQPFVARDVGLDAGDELCRAEGLDDVVIGTEAEAAYLVHVFPFRRYHQDGDFLFFTDAAADMEAVDAGQHDIQQDEVEILL